MAYLDGFRTVSEETFFAFIGPFDVIPQEGPQYFLDNITRPSEYMTRTNYCQRHYSGPMAIALHTDKRYDEHCELQHVPESEKKHVYLIEEEWYARIPPKEKVC